MLIKCSAPFKASGTEPRCQRKMLTIAEKVEGVRSLRFRLFAYRRGVLEPKPHDRRETTPPLTVSLMITTIIQRSITSTEMEFSPIVSLKFWQEVLHQLLSFQTELGVCLTPGVSFAVWGICSLAGTVEGPFHPQTFRDAVWRIASRSRSLSDSRCPCSFLRGPDTTANR